jgi:hypothetical protein
MGYNRQIKLLTKCVPNRKALVNIVEARAGKGNYQIEVASLPEHGLTDKG